MLNITSSIHICITLNTAYSEAAKDFLRDLRSVTEEVMNDPKKGEGSATVRLFAAITFFDFSCLFLIVEKLVLIFLLL